jgi:hypothetical protein
MLSRDSTLDDSKGFVVRGSCNLVRIYPVAQKALGSAEPTPLGDKLGIAREYAQQDFLVVSKEKDRFNAAPAVRSKTLDDLGGVGTAIDEVTKKHQQALAGRLTIEFGVNLGEEILEEVEPPVDVTNHVSAIARSPHGLALRWRGGTKHQATDKLKRDREKRLGTLELRISD